jgi:hypothetical protein
LPLLPAEEKVLAGFPGEVGRFSDGSGEILFRRVSAATRNLHPNAECLRASGYAVTALPAVAGADGRVWSRMRAIRDGAALEVLERVEGADGRSWSDVSAWYWSALLGRTEGPWTAVTVSRRIDQ